MATREKKQRATDDPNIVFVLSGASGSGKTSITARVVENTLGLEKSISYTTREIREGEVPGVSYHFISDGEFTKMVKNDEFAEHAEVHGNHYGTAVEEIARRLDDGKDVICDIDVQGGAAIRKIFGERAVLIFVLPPTWAELERRLRGRGTDDDDVIVKRLARAREEHRHAPEYDYLVVNNELSAASTAVTDIVRAERMRTARVMPKLPPGLLGRGPASRR